MTKNSSQGMATCLKCGAQSPAGARFCPVCGQAHERDPGAFVGFACLQPPRRRRLPPCPALAATSARSLMAS